MTPPRRRPGVAAIAIPVVVVAALTACSGGAADEAQVSAALAASRPVTFANDDGDRLAGRLFGPDDATAGVVLVHGLAADQRVWYPFADRLGDAGFRALTFNLRGVCPRADGGCSGGTASGDAAPADVRAAIAALRDDGVRRIALVGSSLGATAALIVAADDDERLATVVSLSGAVQIGRLAVGPDVLARVDEPKLFLAGTGDPAAAAAAEDFFNATLQPKRLEVLTTDDHGAEILRGNQSEQARNAILSWLAVYLAEEAAAA